MDNLATLQPGPTLADKRGVARVRALLAAKILIGDGRMSADCMVRNLSTDGARVRISRTVPLPQTLGLLLIKDGLLFDAALAWRKDDEAGLTFTGRHDVKTAGDPAHAHAHRIWAEHAPR